MFSRAVPSAAPVGLRTTGGELPGRTPVAGRVALPPCRVARPATNNVLLGAASYNRRKRQDRSYRATGLAAEQPAPRLGNPLPGRGATHESLLDVAIRHHALLHRRSGHGAGPPSVPPRPGRDLVLSTYYEPILRSHRRSNFRIGGLRPDFAQKFAGRRRGESMTAGEALRGQMDAALARAAKDAGRTLEWTEPELHHLAAAARAADRVELLNRQLAAEVAAENRPTVVVKVSAELRALDKAVGEHLGRVEVGEGTAKSAQHQAAVRARWDRRDADRAAARGGA
jgi:hypothetical protein